MVNGGQGSIRCTHLSVMASIWRRGSGTLSHPCIQPLTASPLHATTHTSLVALYIAQFTLAWLIAAFNHRISPGINLRRLLNGLRLRPINNYNVTLHRNYETLQRIPKVHDASQWYLSPGPKICLSSRPHSGLVKS